MSDTTVRKEMGAFERIIGVFTSPKETFESIDTRPTWLLPFVIIMVITLGFMAINMDINIKDQMAALDHRDMPAEQYQRARANLEGPMRYVQFGIVPIATLIVWAILSGIFLFAGNTVMGGGGTFKRVFSVVAWSGLIGALGYIVKQVLVVFKGTNRGVTTSLAALLPAPELGGNTSVLYKLLSKFDIFTIWQLVIWIIGFAIVFSFTNKKSAAMVISLFVIWTVVSIVLGQLLGNMFHG